MEKEKDKHIAKSHNKSALLYHVVCPVGYRQKAIDDNVAETLKNICIEISRRYEIHFMEIGTDIDHVHFLIQSVPMLSPKSIVQTVKNITGMEISRAHPEVRKMLWGGKFWTNGYYVNTVGVSAGVDVIQNYIKNQGTNQKSNYKKYHSAQPTLFEGIF